MVIGASVPEDIFRALLQGTPPGAVYALVALGFVLTYKTSGVFNLAFGAQAYVSAAMYFKLRVISGWGILPSVLIAVFVMAPLLGLVLERLIFRNLRTASPLPRLVLTIGLSVALPSLFDELADYHIVPGRTPEGVVNNGSKVFYDVFGIYAFSRNELVAMAVALVATLGLAALFRFTALGVQMRAVVESRRLTDLHGIASDRISAASWMLSSLFAGTAGVLIAPRFQTLAAANFFQLMVVAIAAAAIGRLVSLPRALIAGLGLGVFIAEVNTFLPRWSDTQRWLRPLQDNVTPAIPFIALFVVLILVPAVRRPRDAGDPLAGVDPPPRIGAAVRLDPRRMRYRRALTAVFLAGVAYMVFTQADQSWLFLVTQAVVMAVIFLSITVVTGMAGEISLCQGAFAAIGGYAVYQLASEHSLPPLVAALVGALIAAAVGAILSLPVRRLGGVWTAIGTLAFAYFFDGVIIKLPWLSGGNSLYSGTVAPRPTLGPIDFANDKSFLVLSIVVLAIIGVVVANIQAGTLGKTLSAARGSQVAAEAIGISPARGRLIAFSLSAFIAALGGALLAMQQQDVNYSTNFLPFTALFWLVGVAVLGIRSVKGALHAAAAFALFDPLILKGALFGWIIGGSDRLPDFFPLSSSWLFILFGLGAIQFARHPEGLLAHQEARRAARHARRLERVRLRSSTRAGAEDESVAATQAVA